MNPFHTLRQKAEFADIVFVCAGPAVLDKPGKFDYTTIRKALCLQTTSSLPDQSRENNRSSFSSGIPGIRSASSWNCSNQQFSLSLSSIVQRLSRYFFNKVYNS